MTSGFMRFLPRMFSWWCVLAVLVVTLWWLAPLQLPVLLYKVALVGFSACLGYGLDRSLFPYARPDGYLVGRWWATKRTVDKYGYIPDQANYPVVPGCEWLFVGSVMRRALIVLAVMVGMGLGL